MCEVVQTGNCMGIITGNGGWEECWRCEQWEINREITGSDTSNWNGSAQSKRTPTSARALPIYNSGGDSLAQDVLAFSTIKHVRLEMGETIQITHVEIGEPSLLNTAVESNL